MENLNEVTFLNQIRVIIIYVDLNLEDERVLFSSLRNLGQVDDGSI